MRSWTWVAIAVITSAGGAGGAGCNQVLGLDPVQRLDATGSDDAMADDGGVIDAADIDANPEDLDGDGIPNALDNCPQVANPLQANEDGDALGDRCDGCPFLPGGFAVNIDGDGVLDACDLDTSVRQCIQWFDGFVRDTRARYVVPSPSSGLDWGTWMHDATLGGLVQEAAAGTGTLLMTQAAYQQPLVSAAGTVLVRMPPINDAGVPVPAWSVGVWLRATHVSPNRLPSGCLIEATQAVTAPAAAVLLYWSAGGSPQLVGSTSTTRTIDADRRFTIGVAAATNAFVGQVDLEGELRLVSHDESCTATPAPAPVGLRTDFVRSRFNYLMIADLDPVHCPPAGPCLCPPPPEL